MYSEGIQRRILGNEVTPDGPPSGAVEGRHIRTERCVGHKPSTWACPHRTALRRQFAAGNECYAYDHSVVVWEV